MTRTFFLMLRGVITVQSVSSWSSSSGGLRSHWMSIWAVHENWLLLFFPFFGFEDPEKGRTLLGTTFHWLHQPPDNAAFKVKFRWLVHKNMCITEQDWSALDGDQQLWLLIWDVIIFAVTCAIYREGQASDGGQTLGVICRLLDIQWIQYLNFAELFCNPMLPFLPTVILDG